MAHAPLPPSFNAYRILCLPAPFASSDSSTPTTLSASAIKSAYRRALLAHHPDKLTASPSSPEHVRSGQNRRHDGGGKTTGRDYTVDDVTLAYKTLLDPAARAAHDRSLRLNSRPGFAATGKEDGDEDEEQWRLGLEAVDLDDLAYDEGGDEDDAGGGRWWRGCRCGEGKGFIVDEAALERAAAAAGTGAGEVLVGCVGCSLWIRVGFAVAED
ncbi:hypothetical protein SLS58_008857 [Diplodia intermedia]|uniref:Diphthamide biosynthesis protein 4 n=1 Tax=Diplodia intermedia TaxID=856260 RepID=A0ABR3TG43_9PEZI